MRPGHALIKYGLFVSFIVFQVAPVFASPESMQLGLPSSPGGQKVLLDRSKFTVLYDNELNNPVWVAEYLTREDVESEAVSRDRFSFSDDPDVDGEPQNSDYTNSGYDRGHMAPAEDMEDSATAMKECFYMTNMVPQKHSLNGGRWKTMEELARKVAVKEGHVWIYSGPVYRTPSPGECSGTIGKKNVVVVPQAFFKIIVYQERGTYHALAFLIPHLEGKASEYGPIDNYLLSIDQVEATTGFDFLTGVDRTLEEAVESVAAPATDTRQFLN